MAQAAAAVAAAIHTFVVAGPRTKEWQGSVSLALARIEYKVDEILQAIRNLHVTLDETLNRQRISEADALYSAYLTRMQQLASLNRQMTEAELKQVNDILVEPKNGLLDSITLLSRLRDGQGRPLYAAYTVLLRGIGAMFYASSLLGSFERKQMGPVARAYSNDLLLPCTLPKSAGSYANTLQSERKFVAAKTAWLDMRGNNRRCLVGVERNKGEVWVPHYVATFSGSPPAGYDYSISSPSEYGLKSCSPPSTGKLAPVGQGRKGTDEAASYILQDLNGQAKLWRAGTERIKGLEETIAAIEQIRKSLERFQ